MRRPARTVSACLGLLAGALLLCPPVAAQQDGCLSYVDTLLDTTDLCVGRPDYLRSIALDTISWQGTPYLVNDLGNDLELWNITDPLRARRTTRSSFGLNPRTDLDENLLGFGVCDDCRFGVAGFGPEGVALFDLGTGSTPIFGMVDLRLSGSPATSNPFRGGMVYKQGGQEYVVVRGLGGCSTGAGLYAINGIHDADLTLKTCVTTASGAIDVVAGWKVQAATGASYLYLLNNDAYPKVNIYQLSSDGSTITWLGSPITIAGTSGFAVDPAEKLAVSVIRDTVTLWDISSPSDPVKLSDTPVSGANTAALTYPMMWVGAGTLGGHTLDVTVPESPTEFDASFWDGAQTWNTFACGSNRSGRFARDASTLYLARWSALQVIDASSCGTAPPTAKISVTPSLPFPGDFVTVANASTGTYQSWAMWVTDVDGTVVEGSQTMSTSLPTPPLSVQIPANLIGTPYTAHLMVDGDQGSSQTTTQIGVNTTPQAKIVVTPVAVLTGALLNLDASTTEGNPTSYSWEVLHDAVPFDPPVDVDPNYDATAEQTSFHIPADGSGNWTVKLTAGYDHYVNDVLYTNTATKDLGYISSVAADFTVSPASPLNTADVKLTSTSVCSSCTGGLPLATWDVHLLDGSGHATGNPIGYSCNDEFCSIATIPHDTVDPGVYRVTLTVTSGNDSSQRIKDVTIGDGNLNLSLAFNPSNPAVGDGVVVSIAGLNGANVSAANWNLGGANCDGTVTQTPTGCDQFLSGGGCAQGYVYKTSGSKTVTVSGIVVDGQSYPLPLTGTLTVADGSCPGTSCSYAVSPTSRSMAASGGTGQFTVSTGTSCNWQASSRASWIRVTAGASGSGGGTVSYSVDANNSTSSRTGSITVQDKSFTVTQAAADTSNVDFTISNANPQIGQEVTFTTSPEPGQNDQVTWHFGGSNCDGDSPDPPTCTTFCQGEGVRTWAYSSPGDKTVSVSINGVSSALKVVHVATTGSCANCEATAAPNAGFSYDPTAPIIGDTVTFTADDAGSAAAQNLGATGVAAADFTVSPTSADIGQWVHFQITGVATVQSANWNLGGTLCDGSSSTFTCTPNQWDDCLQDYRFRYSSSGSKTVSLTVNGQTITHTVEVSTNGTCGEATCSYSLSALSRSFDATGGTGSVNVYTGDGCAWKASSAAAWVKITAGSSGSGAGTVSYSVDANQSTGSRSGTLTIAGKTYTVQQAGASGGGGGGGDPNAATSWSWTLRQSGNVIATGKNPTFTYTFTKAGTYLVQLDEGNCYGSDTASRTITVEEKVEPQGYVVPAAAHAEGQNSTVWRTDLRTFNPGTDPLTVSIDYLPEATNNSGAVPGVSFNLAPKGTTVLDDILGLIPGLGEGANKGSLRFQFTGGGNGPAIMSRTYNLTDHGTYGQYVAAVPVLPTEATSLVLPGLAQDSRYRTNVGIANLSDHDVGGLTLRVLDQFGKELGTYGVGVPAQSTIQVVNVARVVGVEDDLPSFTVVLDTNGTQVAAYASVVDNLTGDPVYYPAVAPDSAAVIVPGMAHLPGANGSMWRSDISLYNDSDSAMDAYLQYVPESDADLGYHITVPLEKREVYLLSDVLGWLLGDETSSKGYFIVSGVDGAQTPLVTARTYNLTDGLGTFGQSIPAFGPDRQLKAGEHGYIPGVTNSADPTSGARTNIGFVNTSTSEPAKVNITIYGEDGSTIGQVPGYTLSPGQTIQFNLFQAVGLDTSTITGSVELNVLSGGPVVAYGSVIDNRTQDPVLVPVSK